MLKSFRKIRALFLASWQESLMYRAEALVWFIGEAIIPLVMVALWLAAYHSVDRIGNYAVEDMVNYYVMFLVLSNLLTPHLEWNTGGIYPQRHFFHSISCGLFHINCGN